MDKTRLCKKCKEPLRLLSLVNKQAPYGWEPITTYICDKGHVEVEATGNNLLVALLHKLAASNLVVVTGSYADGSQRPDSDIDFYVKPDHPDWHIRGKARHIELIMQILDAHGVVAGSNRTGHLFVKDLPISLEFSDEFDHRPNRLKRVKILGVEFLTH